MIQNKKQMFIVIAVFTLILLLGTTTYAFFNYTRTGANNIIKVGRISFTTNQNKTISLTNLFPIDPTEEGIMDDNTKVGTLEITITGDTDYADGIEYLVSSVDSNIYTNEGQALPISLDVTVSSGLGTNNDNYFLARNNTNESIYKRIVGDTLVGDQVLLIGYIKKNTTSGTIEGINGKITFKAYLDKNKILISDTYDGTESDNMGTTNSMTEGKTVITTSEWNALQSSGVSFKVKVEANEGIWVIGTLEEIMKRDNIGIDNANGVDFSKTSEQDNTSGVYVRAGTENDNNPILYYRGAVDNNVMFANNCWKAVRTTDTGGVKLIYNGQPNYMYEPNGMLSRDDYSNVINPLNLFSFDSSDNTWNITITNGINPSISFTVAAGDNYSLVMTGTSGYSSGGAYFFKKNGTTVYSNSGGGGAAYAYTYSFGTLTDSDIITFQFNGSATETYPVTFKIKMVQNDVPLAQNDYNLVEDSFEFNDATNKWSSSVPYPHRAMMSFNISESGDYILEFTNPGGGPFYVFKNDEVVSSLTGTQQIKMLNLQKTDKIIVDYSQYNSSSGNVEFSFTFLKNNGLGCTNTGGTTQISSGMFNTSYNSPAYNGYMYGDVYEANNDALVTGAYFGSSFTWDGTNYKLTNTSSTKDQNHHYTCNQSTIDGTCTTIRYYFYDDYYINLTNGDGVEEAIKKMQTNTTDSNAKSKIDTWYANNMTEYTSKLEDTIYCNDRSFGDGNNNGWKSSGGDLSTYLLYGASERSNYAENTSTQKNQPTLSCINKNDSFTVNNSKGNQALTYPVGLLTMDEAVLGGTIFETTNDTSYLVSGGTYWLMSAYYFSNNETGGLIVSDDGDIAGFRVGGYIQLNGIRVYSSGFRPVISVKPGMPILKGTGTVTDPYVIE